VGSSISLLRTFHDYHGVLRISSAESSATASKIDKIKFDKFLIMRYYLFTMTSDSYGKLRFYMHFIKLHQTSLLNIFYVSALSIANSYAPTDLSQFGAKDRGLLHSNSKVFLVRSDAYGSLTYVNVTAVRSLPVTSE
jgi:hypothetical protein